MLARFDGTDGARRLLDMIARQPSVNGDAALAQALIDHGNLVEFKPGESLMEQGSIDSDVFFLLSGNVAIEINGLAVATRRAGEHVGEMAAIDPSARRSASVTAIETTAALRVEEAALVAIADDHPQVWRRFAVQLAARLRERSRFIRVPNERPLVFVGSSREMLPIAQELQRGLTDDEVTVTVWTDGVFRASRDSVSNLLAVAERSDFAVLVVGPDDVVTHRGTDQPAPRDNVIFELGLFIGSVGRDRTYLVKARGDDLRLPTDLLGLEPIQFNNEGATLASRLGPACTEVKRYIREMGVR